MPQVRVIAVPPRPEAAILWHAVVQLNQGQASPFKGKIWYCTLNSCPAKTNSAINSFPVRPPSPREEHTELSGGKKEFGNATSVLE